MSRTQPFRAKIWGSSRVVELKLLLPCLFVALVFLISLQQPRVPRIWRTSNGCDGHVNGSAIKEELYQQWLSSFTAADPAYQNYCSKVLRGEKTPGLGAQFSQDVFLFHNMYKAWALYGRKGFYVESGANDAEALSSSLFFDKCLGWQGLCVEPQPQYHEGIRKKRSCTLVPECISANKTTLSMSMDGVTGAIAGSGGLAVQCAPISDILARYTNGSQSHIDLWILDVEGHEMAVLKGTNFSETPVDAMLIEDFWQVAVPRTLDVVSGQNNFVKLHQLAIDSIYVRRGTPAARSMQPFWYPPSLEADVEQHVQFAKQVQAQLKKVWGW